MLESVEKTIYTTQNTAEKGIGGFSHSKITKNPPGFTLFIEERSGGMRNKIDFIYFRCFNIHCNCPYSVSLEVQCSLIGVINASFGQSSVL